MLSLLARYGPSILLAIAPLLTTGRLSLLDLLHLTNADTKELSLWWVPFGWGYGPKADVEVRCRAALTVIGVIWLVVYGYFDAVVPTRTLKGFRHEYIADVAKNQWRKRSGIRSSLRINVMYLRWRWWMPFGRSFQVVWKDKFEPSDRDGHIRLYQWQGACGKAAKIKDAYFVDFRTTPPEDEGGKRKFLGNRFHLLPWQLWKTKHLRAILSVPIFEVRGKTGQEEYVCVGAINIDAKTDNDADYLSQNAKGLAVGLAKSGQLIGKMR